MAEYLRVCFPYLIPGFAGTDILLAMRWNLELAGHWYAGEGRTVDLRPDLAAIRAPTLVLVGERDPQHPLASMLEAVEALPPESTEIRRYPEAHHSPMRDAPESLDAIREFVRSMRVRVGDVWLYFDVDGPKYEPRYARRRRAAHDRAPASRAGAGSLALQGRRSGRSSPSTRRSSTSTCVATAAATAPFPRGGTRMSGPRTCTPSSARSRSTAPCSSAPRSAR